MRYPASFCASAAAAALLSCGGAGNTPTPEAPVEPASLPAELPSAGAFEVVADIEPEISLPEVGTVELVHSLVRMPSGIAVHGRRVFVAVPRWVEQGAATLYELREGGLVAYPNAAANDLGMGPAALTSVNGLHVDSRGWLWILDNARVDLEPAAESGPKLVVWDTVGEREVFRHVFSPDIAPPAASFLNDIVVDEEHGFAYITESGMGGTPCLIAFEIHRGIARRLLEGHVSVIADPERDIEIDGETVMVHRPDGPTPWRVAANAIALEPGGRTLRWGPTSSERLYAVDTQLLRDPDVSSAAIEAAISSVPKPISDGIAISPDGRLFATDVENARVVELGEDGSVDVASDPRFSFPVALEAPGDGWLWFTSNQLHRMPLLRAGDDARVQPYYIWRVRI